MATYPQTSFTAPAGAARITLVRHGQSEAASLDKPFALKHGHGDPPLTELGHRQAEAVGARMADEAIDAIYVTSLTRTHQTAAPLAGRLGRDPIEEHDLREVFLGDWEAGLFRHMVAEQQHPAAVEFRRTFDFGVVPGAESNAELRARTVASLERLRLAHPDEHVVCFVHGGVIAALCAHATGAAAHTGFSGADNGSIHRLVLGEERWWLRSFNDTVHLGDVMTPQAVVETIA